tara:strand:+ start:38229 stop:39377 length:1149 start_codon:yes stop_codon:yes gene_type:complete
MKDCLLDFDFQSSTPCSQEVLDAMLPFWLENWGNPSSRQNRLGLLASAAISVAREELASLLKVKQERIIFTSGATEANNLALIGHAHNSLQKKGLPGHLITLATEHHAVLDPLRQLKNEGFRLTELRPDSQGIISLNRLEEAFEDDTILVSIMLANNEIGVLQPIREIAALCKERSITFHSDAAQGFGYLPLDFDDLDVDLMSLSAHKIYGPKGVGALIKREEVVLSPLAWGGGQENKLRPGTLPVPLIIGFAKAAEILNKDLFNRVDRLKKLRNIFIDELSNQVNDLIINGSLDKRLPHNLNITIPGVNGNRLHRELRPLINCSSGSACSNGSPSHVLLAIGRSKEEAQASLRLSLGAKTTVSDVREATDLISKVVRDLRG